MGIKIHGQDVNMIDYETANRLLRYEPKTGKIYWRVNRGPVKKGAEAGGVWPDGYRYIGFNGTSFLAHRLAWFLYHGYMSENPLILAMVARCSGV